MQLKTLLVLIFATLSGAFLVYTSQAVQDAQRELRLSRAAFEKETQTMRVLQAEWAFLSAPSRLEDIAGEKLELQADEPRIIPSLDIIRKQPEAQPQGVSFAPAASAPEANSQTP